MNTPAIVNSRTEYKINPMGMDEASPRFSFQISGTNEMVSEYSIEVFQKDGKSVWNSGFIHSGETIQIAYDGIKLKPFTEYHWIANVVLESGRKISTSKPYPAFETGFMDEAWDGCWISGKAGLGHYRPASRFSRELTIEKKLRRARLYSTALGLYSAFVNGIEITEDRFTPGWTQYNDHVQYQAYDVTKFLTSGQNVLSAIVGDGWYCGMISYVGIPDHQTGYGEYPMFRAILRLEYEDGTLNTIATDETWNSFFLFQALLDNDIYLGEKYDAMFDDESWKLPGYQKTCNSAGVQKEECSVKIVWSSGNPVRVIREIPPVSIRKHFSGTYILDFGENITGVEKIHIKTARPGAVITIRHGEMLYPDGTLYRDNLLFAQATTQYTCGRKDNVYYSPRFTYYGFRYLEISGWNGDMLPDDVHALALSCDTPRIGFFSCSNELLNKLFSNIIRSQQGNFLDVPTDCPQRCERFGWTGDAQIFAETAAMNFYVPAFFTKWIYDLNVCTAAHTGAYPSIAPYAATALHPDNMSNAGWSDAGVICPWMMYRQYGDIRILSKWFHKIKRYTDLLISQKNPGSIGDHLNLDAKTQPAYIGEALRAEMVRITSVISKILEKNEPAQYYQQVWNELRQKFYDKHFTADGILLEKTQTAAAMAIVYQLIPNTDALQKTIDFLVHDITVSRQGHLSTGFLGTPILLNALKISGRLDIAYVLLEQTTYPSWLYPVTKGATTIWERWNGWTEKDGFYPPNMNSFNHYAYGAVGAWLYQTVCGIRDMSEERTEYRGYRHFCLRPYPGGSLTHARASLNTQYGEIISEWNIDDTLFTWKFTIPCNTTANIILPPHTKETIPSELIKEDEHYLAKPGTYEIRIFLKNENR